MQLSTEQLLSLTSLFEKRALNKLRKLVKEADSASLLQGLESIILVKIPSDVFDEWLAKNASILGDALDYNWWPTHTINNQNILLSNSKGENPKDSIRKIISKVPYEEDHFDLSSESILIEHKIIPKLHIVSGKYNYPENPGLTHLPADFAHDAYLVQAMANITWKSIDEDLIKKVQSFYKKNRTKIDSLRRFFAKPPAYLGGGSDGSAFDIGNGLVLKIFGDKFSYDAALKAQERLHKFPQIAKTEAMIYDAGELGKFDNSKKIFYTIMEKMKPAERNAPEGKFMHNILFAISKEIEPILESRDWLIDKKNIDDPKTYPALKLKVRRTARIVAKHIREKDKNLLKELKGRFELNNYWLDELVEEILMKWLTGRGDLHSGNIGSTNYGKLRYFDPAYRTWQKNLNLPTGRI